MYTKLKVSVVAAIASNTFTARTEAELTAPITGGFPGEPYQICHPHLNSHFTGRVTAY